MLHNQIPDVNPGRHQESGGLGTSCQHTWFFMVNYKKGKINARTRKNQRVSHWLPELLLGKFEELVRVGITLIIAHYWWNNISAVWKVVYWEKHRKQGSNARKGKFELSSCRMGCELDWSKPRVHCRTFQVIYWNPLICLCLNTEVVMEAQHIKDLMKWVQIRDLVFYISCKENSFEKKEKKTSVSY